MTDEVAIARSRGTNPVWAASIALFTVVVLNLLVLLHAMLVIVAVAALVVVGGVLLARLAGAHPLTGLRRPWRQRSRPRR